MTWHREYTPAGGLTWALRERPGLVAHAILVRTMRNTFDLITAEQTFTLHGSLCDVKQKAEGMLGL